ncbi:hypothetical protein KM789_13345 [Clostridium tyrobutyricum]|nr:hypothetical protein [Clostridium tyrobutyricum]
MSLVAGHVKFKCNSNRFISENNGGMIGMYNWCMQHPWMTFFILFVLADSVGHWFHSSKNE